MIAKFLLLTDTHFFKADQGAVGQKYDEFMKTQQKCYAQSESINRSVFDFLAKTDEVDTILIAGDLSFDGDKQSHLELIKLMKKVKASGKRIFVVTAGHDYNENPKTYIGADAVPLEATKRDELFDLYYEFGFEQATSVDKAHLSYTADLSETVKLFALNNDLAGKKNPYFDQEQMQWIKGECEKAKSEGKVIIGMNHYPLLAGQPIFSLIKSAMQSKAGETTEKLADWGMHLVFTGHMHNQSINKKISKNGNKFFDVCTGSIIQAPAFMRIVTVLDENTVEIKSIACPEFDYEKGTRNSKEYLDDTFDASILNMIEKLKRDTNELNRKLGSSDGKFKSKVLELVGKVADEITLGKACKILCVKCPTELKNVLVKNFAARLTRMIFEGNQTYKIGTNEGDLVLKLVKRLNPILKLSKIKNNDGEVVDMFEIIKHTIGNYDIDDYDATLKL